MDESSRSAVIGVFKGMGDLLSAAPVILEELRRPRTVHLLLFPNATLREFGGLIDFAPHRERLYLHALPIGSNLAEWARFVSEMRRIQAGMVWISPHAPIADSSWKIPLLLRSMQMLFWKDAELAGADTERFSWMFHRRLSVDRGLPLRLREWSAYRMLRGELLQEQPPKIRFLPAIADRRKAPPLFDLVIHPGATARNRLWPARHYGALIDRLPREWRIGFVGLPDDLAAIKPFLPEDRPVHFVTGTIAESIKTLASAAMLLVVDSGNMHFAEVLGVPALAIFGYTDPANVIDPAGCVETLYERRFPCQPCGRAVCSQPEVYCMDGMTPEAVAKRLERRAASATLSWPSSPSVLDS